MASSVIIFYKSDVVITTIQEISSKTFKTFHMVEKTTGCVEHFWEIEIEALFTLPYEYVSFLETFFWS